MRGNRERREAKRRKFYEKKTWGWILSKIKDKNPPPHKQTP